MDTELHFKYLNLYKSKGIIPPGLKIRININTGHRKESSMEWNDLLKKQSLKEIDFLLNENDAKFIKVLDEICGLKDCIYSECEDLDEANSIFDKLSTAKDTYIHRVESRKKKKLENHKKKFLKSNQNNLSGKDTHKFTRDNSPKDNVSNPHKKSSVRKGERRSRILNGNKIQRVIQEMRTP